MAGKRLPGGFTMPVMGDRLQERLMTWWLKYFLVVEVALLVVGFLIGAAAGSAEEGALIMTSRLAYAYAVILGVAGIFVVLTSLVYSVAWETG